MFGMEMAQENIQASLGNVKKPDFPEQSFYSESLNAEHEVEQKEQGMAPSDGPTVEDQKHEEAVETKTETALDKIKAHADANGNGENETGFNAFDELENSLFTIGEHFSKNSRIYTSAGTTLAGGALGAAIAHHQAKKTGKTGSEYRKLIAKKAALGAAAGLAVGEASHVAHSVYGLNKKLKEKGHTWKEVLKNPKARKELRQSVGMIMTSRKHGSDVKNW